MKHLLILFGLLGSLAANAQSYSSSDLAQKVATPGILGLGTTTTSTTSWTVGTYNQLVAEKTLKQGSIYLLNCLTTASGQEQSMQLYVFIVTGMNQQHTTPGVLTPLQVIQTSGSTNKAIDVRLRKPQTPYDSGTTGLEATLVNSNYASGGQLTYQLIPLYIPL